MAGPSDLERQKHDAATAAVAEVAAGMLVGLGTGSTAAHAIAALGRRVAGGLAIRAVATSERTAVAARAAGIQVVDFADVATVDLAIDGVDEIDPELRAIKGGGGAMLREKIVAHAARRMIAVADMTKPVARLGAHPMPAEVLPFARASVARRIAQAGGEPVPRPDASGALFRTDQGNVVLDCRFGPIADPGALAERLSRIPGLLGHGLFVTEIDALYVATGHGVERRERPGVS